MTSVHARGGPFPIRSSQHGGNRQVLADGFGIRVSGFECRVPGFGFRVPGFGFQVSGLWFQVSDFWLPVSGSRLRISGVESTGAARKRQKRAHFGFRVPVSRSCMRRLSTYKFMATKLTAQLLGKIMLCGKLHCHNFVDWMSCRSKCGVRA